MNRVLAFFKKSLIRFIRFLKDEPHKFAAYLIALTALGQLALSQVHISCLVRVKLTVSTVEASNYTTGMPSIGIGMFNFLFILFGLATIFNATRANTRKREIITIGFIGVTLFFGIVYVLKATNPDSLVDYADVAPSILWMNIAFSLYGIATAFILFHICKKTVKKQG